MTEEEKDKLKDTEEVEAQAEQTDDGVAMEAEATESEVVGEDGTTGEVEASAEEKAGEEESKTPSLEQQLEELKDKYLRQMAEFDNYRKRTLKEKTELILGGANKTVAAMLPVLDDMERAMANASKAESMEKLEEGWELIFKKMMKQLETLGVKKMDVVGKDFDVDYHEAIAMVPGMGDDKKGKVVDCVETGYMLGDKVVRHAKVAVGQ